MKNSNINLDFLHEIAKEIAARSENCTPILQEEIFDIFKDTLEKVNTARIIEVPIFTPFLIEKEDDLFIARCLAYRACRGIGLTEDEATQKLKGEIDLYNRTCIDSERKMRMEEMVKSLFPKDRF